jgi:tRNA(Arg) A34 adenosine deaminase TadA
MINEDGMKHLDRCVELATRAVDTGNPPFGAVLVDEHGDVLFEGHNLTADGDNTQHPEFAIARWAAANMTPDERAAATVYTSGEHCPMCAAAHGWVGLGRIVYASSSQQLAAWLDELHAAPPPVATLPIHEVVPGLPVEGPFPVMAEVIRQLHERYQTGGGASTP